jgi:hypothetical protein
MVDITVGAIPPVQNNSQKGKDPRRQASKKKMAKDRRKNKQDRRQSVRTGVVVTLSKEGSQFMKSRERRNRPDRRKATP